MTNVDELAQVIRQVDGQHLLGAGALAEAILAKLPHLAARQPVGAAPQGCDACDRTGIRQNDEGRNICCPDCDLGRACAGDTHQPVGEPVAYVDLANWRAGLGADECFFTDWQDDDTVPLYTALPAQAVDLVAVRYALDAAEGLAVACASVDGFSREEIASAGREMRKQFADARALIDSQAVGNG